MDFRQDALQSFDAGFGRTGRFYALEHLQRAGFGPLGRLPVSLRVVLESLLRNCDGRRVREGDLRALASWQKNAPRIAEVPFVVGRVLLQDFTGVPLLVDLAAMRSTVARLGGSAASIEPSVPVDLVVDHSVQVDFFGQRDALSLNVAIEFRRNQRRYEFLKWGAQAFDTFRIVPSSIGICHQVNLEYLARGVLERDGVYYPDTVVGTDSHTTMINGLGVLGWGVGGIEAEAAMLEQPVYFLMPDVVGVHLSGRLPEGTTATDLVLHITEMLRAAKVVGKLVEFHGEGAATLAVPDRATIGNMAPEYGATCGYFPVDEQTTRYLASTGRSREQVAAVEGYHRAQGLWGVPRRGECDYSTVIELDLGDVVPSVAGPKRPQDRVPLNELPRRFHDVLRGPAPTGYGRADKVSTERWPIPRKQPAHLASAVVAGGGNQDPATVPDAKRVSTSSLTEREMVDNRPTPDRLGGAVVSPLQRGQTLGDGDVLIAAITSCTNTSNPSVMIAAGLVAKKAVERGLSVSPTVKTSLAPGSRVVTSYLEKTGLQPHLDALGFNTVAYGCTTCIGNSGPLDPALEEVLAQHDVVAASVLSGNRNFEARVHQSIKANFLMSPPLVVAYALAGRIDIDFEREPVGHGDKGNDVFLRDIWPTPAEVQGLLEAANDPEVYRELYADLGSASELWSKIPSPTGELYTWDPASTYIREPPYFTEFGEQPPTITEVRGARALAIFGDSITTDHISPAGAIKPTSPAGLYLQQLGVVPGEFNSYGARRGNHEVMVRGTFANIRIKNLMVPGVEGGVTVHQPSGERMSIYDAAMRYQHESVPLVVFAGHEYGTGSSRDWAAKGMRLLGGRAVVAKSFERIHRSNLIGMGVLPCQFAEGTGADTLGLEGTETFDIRGIGGAGDQVRPQMQATLVVHRKDGRADSVPVTVRIDTPIEVEYFRRGGILQYVLHQKMFGARAS